MKAIDLLIDSCNSLYVIGDKVEGTNVQDVYFQEIIELDELLREVVDSQNIERLADISSCLEVISELEDGTLFDNNTLCLISQIFEKLSQNNDLWEYDIEVDTEYEIYCIEDAEIYNMIYVNSSDLNNAMLVLNRNKAQDYTRFWEDNEDGCILFLYMLKLLNIETKYETILLAPQGLSQEQIGDRLEFVKLYSVLNGKVFVNPQEYTYNPVNICVKYNTAIKYIQFKDIIEVMNEYNEHKSILDKYLRIYQVIENYMYKFQICKFCNEHDYEKITVRHFKSLSENLAKGEKDAIQKLLEQAGNQDTNGNFLKNRIFDSWNEKIESNLERKANVKDLLELLGENPDSINSVTVGNIMNILARLIYAIRCSVVHNKVNEYHITYSNLKPNIKILLEEFLMPNMELLVYELMLNENEIVMYKQKCLSLY